MNAMDSRSTARGLEVREGVDEATVAAVAASATYKYGFRPRWRPSTRPRA